MVMSEDYLRQHFDAVRDEASVIEQRLCDDPDLERLIFCSDNFRRDCEQFGIPCLEIDGEYNIDEIQRRAEELLGLTAPKED